MICKIVAALIAVIGLGSAGVYFAASDNPFGTDTPTSDATPSGGKPCCALTPATCDVSAGCPLEVAGCCSDSAASPADAKTLATAAAFGGCAAGVCEKK